MRQASWYICFHSSVGWTDTSIESMSSRPSLGLWARVAAAMPHLSRRRYRYFSPLNDRINAFILSFNGEKYLYRRRDKWGIAAATRAQRPNEGLLDMDSMDVSVHPTEEWKQMYHEAWRIERDYFWAKNYVGLDLAAVEKEYAPYLPGIVS